MRGKKLVMSLVAWLSVFFTTVSCSGSAKKIAGEQNPQTITKYFDQDGIEIEISFVASRAHNHPTFAIWLEDVNGNLLQTVFVTRSVATGYFSYGDAGSGKWMRQPGRSIRPAALPVWLHKREGAEKDEIMPTPEKPVADAFSGATPKSSFNLNVKSKSFIPDQFRVLVEINQPWDWNKTWHNNRFPDNFDYRSSAQPSLIYAVDINRRNPMPEYFLNPVGHGHPAGDDGRIYTDISGHTTAFDIFKQIKVSIR